MNCKQLLTPLIKFFCISLIFLVACQTKPLEYMMLEGNLKYFQTISVPFYIDAGDKYILQYKNDGLINIKVFDDSVNVLFHEPDAENRVSCINGDTLENTTYLGRTTNIIKRWLLTDTALVPLPARKFTISGADKNILPIGEHNGYKVSIVNDSILSVFFHEKELWQQIIQVARWQYGYISNDRLLLVNKKNISVYHIHTGKRLNSIPISVIPMNIPADIRFHVYYFSGNNLIIREPTSDSLYSINLESKKIEWSVPVPLELSKAAPFPSTLPSCGTQNNNNIIWVGRSEIKIIDISTGSHKKISIKNGLVYYYYFHRNKLYIVTDIGRLYGIRLSELNNTNKIYL